MSITRKVTGGLLVLALSDVAHGGEFKIHPSITVDEEYTDNVFEAHDHRVSDFITRTMPGIALAYKAPALTADVNYQFDYRYYAKGSRSSDQTHNVIASGKLTAAENLLFLEVSDVYQRVSQNVSKDLSRESLFFNQLDQNVASISPYITLQPSAKTKVKTGYRFVDTRYFDPTGVDKTNHIGFLDVAYEFSPKWFITWGYTYTREEASVSNFDQHQPWGGFRYEYAEKSFLFGQAGYTWILYTDGRRLSNEYWNVGFSHVFNTLVTTINTGVRYDEDPLLNVTQETFVNGSLEKQLKRGSLGISLYYSEYGQSGTNKLQTRKYGGAAKGKYEFTARLSGSLGLTAENYYDTTANSHTRRLVVESGLSYLLAETLTLALNHIYVDSYSPGIAMDNYQVNRVIAEVRKVF
jgi:hypothetical protein